MSFRGRTAVTPVRIGPWPTRKAPSPLTIVACPTSTPATSVMAFSRPVGSVPTTTFRSRARTRGVCAAGIVITVSNARVVAADNRVMLCEPGLVQRDQLGPSPLRVRLAVNGLPVLLRHVGNAPAVKRLRIDLDLGGHLRRGKGLAQFVLRIRLPRVVVRRD